GENRTMPVHDWTRVEAGVFYAFHHGWVEDILRALNRGILPSDYYSLPEQISWGLGPHVFAFQQPGGGTGSPEDPKGGVALATAPPQVQMRLRSEPDMYATKAKAVVVRDASNHKVIAIVEVVSPGNKSSRHGVRDFAAKAVEMLRAGIHLLI